MKQPANVKELLVATITLMIVFGSPPLAKPQSNAESNPDTQGQSQGQSQEQSPGQWQEPSPVPYSPGDTQSTAGDQPQNNHPFRLKRGGSSDVDPEIAELERRMWQRVNQDRRENGSPPINMTPQLSKLARDYAEYMMKANFFAHVDPKGRSPETRARDAGFLGAEYENIAWASRMNADIDRLMSSEDQMMAEPRGQKNHRYNLLVPQHSAIGIGIARSKRKLIMVQEFVDAPEDAR
jgi:uncharacterized protein YkwD